MNKIPTIVTFLPVLLVLSVLAVLLFTGCSVVQTEFVKVPVKCEIEKPKQQAYKDDEVEFVKSLTIYTEELEKALEFCVGELK